jgi:hypothetical protein
MKENIPGARKKILIDFVLLLFGEFTFFINLNVVGHEGKGRQWQREAKYIYSGQLLRGTSVRVTHVERSKERLNCCASTSESYTVIHVSKNNNAICLALPFVFPLLVGAV